MCKEEKAKNFICKSSKIHSDKYDYSLVDYKNAKTKVKIICPEHGIFEQLPGNHSCGSGCKLCGVNKRSKSQSISFDEFIKMVTDIHGDKYDYSLVNYKNCETKVKIICPEHGIFEQRPYSHYKSGNGCIKCAEYKVGKSFMKSNKEFIDESNSIHDFRYDYSLVEYNGSRCNVKILCVEHGLFNQTPTNHIRGKGCPKCKSSKGEIVIRKILNKKGVNFNEQHTFKDCVNKQLLKFDFYLPDYNICIEYDGIQHFEPIEYFGGDVKFKQVQLNDNIKSKYCEKNRVKLIRIKFDSDVETELNEINFND